MNLEEKFLELEEQFWKGNADFCRRNLTDDCLMVFPEPVGVLVKDQIVQSISGSPRWASVGFEEHHVAELTKGAAIVTYKAIAQHESDESTYSALGSSAYVNRGGLWKLAFHQQTPIL